MSKAADDIRKNVAGVRNRRTTQAQPAPELAPVRSKPAVRTRRVRRTVDLTANTHRDLGRWSDQMADELGLTRVTSQDVLAALVDELLSSEELQTAVRRRIEAARS